MNIRPATTTDRSEWLRIRHALWPGSPDQHRADIATYFGGERRFIKQVFVADVGEGRLAGFIELNIRSYAEGSDNPQVPYVEGWYVDPAYRGQGVGRALMQRAEAWTLALGYAELASDAELANQGAIDAHQALGFQEVERTVSFLKELM